MLKKILIVLAVVAAIILAFAGFVALQPGDFHVERAGAIAAPPADVFAHVNDFHK